MKQNAVGLSANTGAYCVIFLDNISFRDDSVNTGKKTAACLLRSAECLEAQVCFT